MTSCSMRASLGELQLIAATSPKPDTRHRSTPLVFGHAFICLLWSKSAQRPQQRATHPNAGPHLAISPIPVLRMLLSAPRKALSRMRAKTQVQAPRKGGDVLQESIVSLREVYGSTSSFIRRNQNPLYD